MDTERAQPAPVWTATPNESAVEWLAGRRVRRTSWRLEGAAWAGGAGIVLVAGYPEVAGFVAVCGAVAFALNHSVWAVGLRMRLPRRSRDGRQSAELADEGLRVSGQAWEILIPWEHVLAVEIGTDAIMVAGDEEWADLLIPRRAFPSAPHFSEFAQSMSDHVEATNNTNT